LFLKEIEGVATWCRVRLGKTSQALIGIGCLNFTGCGGLSAEFMGCKIVWVVVKGGMLKGV
jgi:hypothetical protein